METSKSTSMLIVEGYGQHKYTKHKSWMVSVSIGNRCITKYSPTKLTKRQYRELKRNTRELVKIPFNKLGEYHDKTCKKCKA